MAQVEDKTENYDRRVADRLKAEQNGCDATTPERNLSDVALDALRRELTALEVSMDTFRRSIDVATHEIHAAVTRIKDAEPRIAKLKADIRHGEQFKKGKYTPLSPYGGKVGGMPGNDEVGGMPGNDEG